MTFRSRLNPVKPANDGKANDGTETVSVTITGVPNWYGYYPPPPTPYLISSSSCATVSISEDANSYPTISVTASSPTAIEPAAGTTATRVGTFNFHRDGPAAAALTVYFTLGGTAGNYSDYQMMSNSVTFAIGQHDVPLVITPINDGKANDGTETVTVTITGVPNWSGYNPPTPTPYLIDSSNNTATVSISEDVPPAFSPSSTRSCTCPPSTIISSAAGAATNAPSQNTNHPIRYADGTIELVAHDLTSDGVGALWGQTRSWTNSPGYSSGQNNGTGWVDSQMPRLLQLNGTAQLAVTLDGQTAFFFDRQTDGSYVEQFAGGNRLVYDVAKQSYFLTSSTGEVIAFSDFTSSQPAKRGQFAAKTTVGGLVTAVTAWTADGLIAEVRATANGITDSYLYAYIGPGVNAGLLASATLRRSTDGGSTWTAVRGVTYGYYDGSGSGGGARDLKTAAINDAAGNPISVDYYRYYAVGEAGGYADALKYAVLGASYDRLKAAAGGTDASVFAASDGVVALYADNYFQYDGQARVVAETASGAGSDGQGTFGYVYTTSGNAAGPNSWHAKTVETLPDGNRNVVYTNANGDVMLKVYVEAATGRQ